MDLYNYGDLAPSLAQNHKQYEFALLMLEAICKIQLTLESAPLTNIHITIKI